MKRTLYTSVVLVAALLVFSQASAEYRIPGFALTDNAQCVGGTLLRDHSTVYDAPNTFDARATAETECQSLLTGDNQCCSVVYSGIAPANAPMAGSGALGTHSFAYKIYKNATIGSAPSAGQNETLIIGATTYWAGLSGTQAQVPTVSIVANPTTVVSGGSSLLTWSSTNADLCTSSQFSTQNARTGSATVYPTETTVYSVTCSSASGSKTAQVTVLVSSGATNASTLQASCRAHPTSASVGEDVLWSSTVSGPPGLYYYTWSGTDALSGTASQVFKRYTVNGFKTGQLTVTYKPQTTMQSSTWIPVAHAAECSVGQSSEVKFNVMGASCVGGTEIGRESEMHDAVQIGMFPENYFAEKCAYLGAVEGDCCQVSLVGSIDTHKSYPSNSYTEFRVVRGGTFSQTESYGMMGTMCNLKNSQTWQCSSVAGTVGTSCTGGGGGGTQTITVDCDNGVQVGSGGGAPECSDGIDNDGDGDVDIRDRGCGTGSGYNPDDPSEGSTGNTTPQCSDGRDNNGDGTSDYPEDPGCSSASDNLELVEPPDLTFSVNPPLIKKNQQCTLSLAARSVATCTLSGPGISRSFTSVNGFLSLKEVITPTISETSTYTLSCTGLNGRQVSKSVDCRIAPTFEEI